jgi:hypothetical protein
MALREPFMVKENFDGATASLSIAAKVGESLKIKELRIGALTSHGFCECFIDRMSIGFFYIGDINANHLEQCSEADALPNLFQRLQQLGVFNGYPIAEGETFTIKPAVAGSTIVGMIVYEIWDAADYKPEDDCGSKSKSFTFINYGTNLAQIDAGKYGPLNSPRNPPEYPAFPFGDVVPAGYEIDLLGILLKDWGGDVDNTANTMRYLRMTKDRRTLFSEDRKGIYCTQGMSYFTWGSIRQTNTDIKLFPQPLTFKPGEELRVELSAASNVTALDVLFAFIEKARRL